MQLKQLVYKVGCHYSIFVNQSVYNGDYHDVLLILIKKNEKTTCDIQYTAIGVG